MLRMRGLSFAKRITMLAPHLLYKPRRHLEEHDLGAIPARRITLLIRGAVGPCMQRPSPQPAAVIRPSG